jgi:hypothetical protein
MKKGEPQFLRYVSKIFAFLLYLFRENILLNFIRNKLNMRDSFKKFLLKTKLFRPYRNKNPVYNQRKPWRLRWADRIHADVKHIACGNGFSLVSISNSRYLKGEHLFGTGINTQSQIGTSHFNLEGFFSKILEITIRCA